MADATKIGVADATKIGVANARVAYLLPPKVGPSPLNVFLGVQPLEPMVFRWFLMLLPSLLMVFDGSGPLVKQCDGFDGSLWSKPGSLHCVCLNNVIAVYWWVS